MTWSDAVVPSQSCCTQGGVTLLIDGDQGRDGGAYHDQNIRLRPYVDPVIPVQASTAVGKAQAFSLLAPQYAPSSRPALSGQDNIPEAFNYEACHNVTILYWSANGAGSLSVMLPK